MLTPKDVVLEVHELQSMSINLIFLSCLIVSGYYALGNSGRALVDISIVISQIGDLSVYYFSFSVTQYEISTTCTCICIILFIT